MLGIVLLLAAFFIGNVKPDCEINISGEPPIITKNVGSKILILQNQSEKIILKGAETIRADCARQIRIDNAYHRDVNDPMLSSVSFRCQDYSQLYVKKLNNIRSYDYEQISNRHITISCQQGNRLLYETNVTLPNCGKYSSYVIGLGSQLPVPIITASLCYDWDTLTLKYIKYQIQQQDYALIDRKAEQSTLENLQLSEPIEGIKLLFPTDDSLGQAIISYQKKNPILHINIFDYANLIQDSKLSNELKDYNYMMKTIWWRNLQLGSWAYFLDALKAYRKFNKYELYTGTTGILTLPATNDCNEAEKFIITTNEKEIHAPEIIWTYLKPLKGMEKNTTEEFVIIGYNTPFYSTANSTNICTDMCDEIHWLKDSLFSRVHLFPTFGVVHCCRVDDQVAMKLEGFPIEISKGIEEKTESPSN